ncbi:hypothetical protein ANN_01108 [Periplaneta americana]|uniref:Reverse transcriptase domain-containing protein n=1 Tax=Periplaneta americana TaxID=6978 RepID=A0ABQ8TVX0_PERAM|nr:hypothetical protein ANN_01108 [Periplaneta americana]
MAADGDCHHLCKLMAPVLHRWSINDVIGGIRNTMVTREMKTGDKIQKEETPNNKFIRTVYFDGRKDRALTQEKKDNGLYRREKEEEHNYNFIRRITFKVYSTYLPFLWTWTSDLKAVLQSLKASKLDVSLLAALGYDGASTNTGRKNGSMVCIEKEIGRPLQRIICLLHVNELRHHYLMKHLAGITTGPETRSGHIGEELLHYFILKELTEKQVSDKFGFEVSENLDNLTMAAFADDLVVIGKDMSAAQDLVLMVKELLEGIGLYINPNKSTSINIVKGKLREEDLILHEDCSIREIKQDETIRYLGVSFNEEITFDREAFMLSLKNYLENLVSTSMLRPDQKLNIVNQYIWPKLIYPLQMAPIHQLPGTFLEDIDKHGCPETETLAHVQGQCNRGLLLRNARHHHVRFLIATALRKKSWIVEEEVFCLATNGSSRRIDIIAYSQTTKKGYIIDPTIRIETGSSQPEDVNQEKINIYLPTVDYFKAKYQLEDIEVIGLLIGARGVIPKFFESFRKTFELPQSLTADIITSVLKRSCQILSHHIHSV